MTSQRLIPSQSQTAGSDPGDAKAGTNYDTSPRLQTFFLGIYNPNTGQFYPEEAAFSVSIQATYMVPVTHFVPQQQPKTRETSKLNPDAAPFVPAQEQKNSTATSPHDNSADFLNSIKQLLNSKDLIIYHLYSRLKELSKLLNEDKIKLYRKISAVIITEALQKLPSLISTSSPKDNTIFASTINSIIQIASHARLRKNKIENINKLFWEAIQFGITQKIFSDNEFTHITISILNLIKYGLLDLKYLSHCLTAMGDLSKLLIASPNSARGIATLLSCFSNLGRYNVDLKNYSPIILTLLEKVSLVSATNRDINQTYKAIENLSFQKQLNWNDESLKKFAALTNTLIKNIKQPDQRTIVELEKSLGYLIQHRLLPEQIMTVFKFMIGSRHDARAFASPQLTHNENIVQQHQQILQHR